MGASQPGGTFAPSKGGEEVGMLGNVWLNGYEEG